MTPHLILLAPVLLLAACATKAPEAAQAANAASSDSVVCTKETPTGSNRPQLVCRNVASAQRNRERDRAATEKLQASPPVPNPGISSLVN